MNHVISSIHIHTRSQTIWRMFCLASMKTDNYLDVIDLSINRHWRKQWFDKKLSHCLHLLNCVLTKILPISFNFFDLDQWSIAYFSQTTTFHKRKNLYQVELTDNTVEAWEEDVEYVFWSLFKSFCSDFGCTIVIQCVHWFKFVE